MRRAAELADDAFEAAIAETCAGADEGAILAAMHAAIFRGGGDYPGNPFIIGSGRDALLCRYKSGRRRLDARDQLTLEFAGVVASIAWPIFIGLIMAPKWAEGVRLLRLAHDTRGAKTVSIEEAYALDSVAQAEENIALSVIYAFGPVIIAWRVLFAAFWVASGFQRQDRGRRLGKSRVASAGQRGCAIGPAGDAEPRVSVALAKRSRARVEGLTRPPSRRRSRRLVLPMALTTCASCHPALASRASHRGSAAAPSPGARAQRFPRSHPAKLLINRPLVNAWCKAFE